MLERTIEVAVPVERAFGVWTEQVNLWWPAGHSISRHPGARMASEARVGGRLMERVPDGPEIVWGRVLTFEAPGRLVYEFTPGGGGEYTSEVEVTFTPSRVGTLVTVTHRMGQFTDDRWGSMKRRYGENWDLVLPEFQHHAQYTDIPTGRADDDFF